MTVPRVSSRGERGKKERTRSQGPRLVLIFSTICFLAPCTIVHGDALFVKEALTSSSASCDASSCPKGYYCSEEDGSCDACTVAICETTECKDSNNCWSTCCFDFCGPGNACKVGEYCFDYQCLNCPSSCGSFRGNCPQGCPRTEDLSIGNIGFFSVAVVLVICSCCFCVVNAVRRFYYMRRQRQYQNILNQPLIQDDAGAITEGGEWDCPVCDFHNTLPTRTCNSCGALRHVTSDDKMSLEMSASSPREEHVVDPAFSKKKGGKFVRRSPSIWSWKMTSETTFRWIRRGGDRGEEKDIEDVDATAKIATTTMTAEESEHKSDDVAVDVAGWGDEEAEAEAATKVVAPLVDRASQNSTSLTTKTTYTDSSALRGWLWTVGRRRRFSWTSASKPCGFELPRSSSRDARSVVPLSGPKIPLREIAEASALPLGRKLQWFRRQLAKLRIAWDDGHVKIEIRRETVLSDALAAFNNVCESTNDDVVESSERSDEKAARVEMHRTTRDMHKTFRFEFLGEPAVDAGGVAREFFELAIQALFDPNFALFRQSNTSAMTYWLGEDSEVAHPDGEDLHYLKFAGRLLGKALFDGHTTGAYLSRALLKHLIHAPLGLSDLRFVDVDLWDMAQWLMAASDEDLECAALDFSVTKVRFGGKPIDVELKPGGCDIPVTRENVNEFLHLRAKYALMTSVSPQLFAFVSGFYDVIPAHLLMIFRTQELELLLSGLPTIDVKDWRAHTEYRGKFSANHKVVRWFWEFVEELSHEMQARLLQFITGTSRVPVSGFRCLVSHDGKMQQFTLQSLNVKLPRALRRLRRRQERPARRGGFFGFGGAGKKKKAKENEGQTVSEPFSSYLLMPKAHTCFNRLDIPLYITKGELRRHFHLALKDTASITGFGLD